MTALNDSRPQLAAPLSDPLYYLRNFGTVLEWVETHHQDLLTSAERDRLQAFFGLDSGSQALLARLVMRQRNVFRLTQLSYPEIGEPMAVLVATLTAQSWLDPDPAIDVPTLAGLLPRDSFMRVAQRWLPPDRGARPSARKRDLVQALGVAEEGARRCWRDWSGEEAMPFVALTDVDVALFRRVRLMFFGNLRQDWSEFVVTELGYQRYEPVTFAPGVRAFQSRAEVDTYLHLADVRDRLEAGEDWRRLWCVLPEAPDNAWLARRHARLVYQLGQAAERTGDFDTALVAYGMANTAESRVRSWRLRERIEGAQALWSELPRALSQARLPGERLALQRLSKRLARRVGAKVPVIVAPAPAPVQRTLRLVQIPGERVEWAVLRHLHQNDAPCWYVENALWTGLLALLCWPAIYAPVPGAFFHPFQAGPTDLFTEDFVTRRRDLLDACLARLTTDDYREHMTEVWRTRHGTACPLVAWPVLTSDLLALALTTIPAGILRRIFEYMLDDLRERRRGLPDLVQFFPNEGRFRLIEVKGPGDRVQDHQREWLNTLAGFGIPTEVWRIEWEAAT